MVQWLAMGSRYRNDHAAPTRAPARPRRRVLAVIVLISILGGAVMFAFRTRARRVEAIPTRPVQSAEAR